MVPRWRERSDSRHEQSNAEPLARRPPPRRRRASGGGAEGTGFRGAGAPAAGRFHAGAAEIGAGPGRFGAGRGGLDAREDGGGAREDEDGGGPGSRRHGAAAHHRLLRGGVSERKGRRSGARAAQGRVEERLRFFNRGSARCAEAHELRQPRLLGAHEPARELSRAADRPKLRARRRGLAPVDLEPALRAASRLRRVQGPPLCAARSEVRRILRAARALRHPAR